MYTDQGMFPRAEICTRYTTIWFWSFHFASGSPAYQALLFSIAAILAFSLLIGFETRLATIGSWLLLVSLQHRVPPVVSGADILLRVLLFWSMFLPLGEVWSFDRSRAARRSGSPPGHDARVVSIGSAAILLQMAFLYFFSGIFKWNVVWLRGEAIAGILAHDFYASPLGAYLLRFPHLSIALSWVTLFLECSAPFLLFFPFRTASIRLTAISALAVMHLGIAIFLEVDLFSPVSMTGLMLFLPSEFWNSKLFARLARLDRPALLTSEPKRPAIDQPLLHYVREAFCLMLLLYVLALNINTLPSHPLAAMALEEWKPLATACALGQRWGMFEAVPSNSGWYVARANLTDGSEVDLLRHGAAVDWAKPQFPAGLYPNYRWRKLFREMAYYDDIGFQVFRVPVAQFLCRRWNGQNPSDKQITELEFVYCKENKPGILNISTPQFSRERLVHLDFSPDLYSSNLERNAAF